MPNVLTKKEFSEILEAVRGISLMAVKKYVRNAELGKKFSSKELSQVRMICYVRNLFMEWEQGDYSNEQFNNLTNDVNIRNLFSTVIKVSKKYV